jgi:hypothetical protein
MVKAPRRVRIWGCILGLGLLHALSAQDGARDLLIQPEDLLMENDEAAGLHLFVRKKPDVASVMLVQSAADPEGRTPSFAYRSLEWNPVNGNEQSLDISNRGARWLLLDSSPETHPALGEAFHFLIPPVLVYGIEGESPGTITVEEGTYVNIRTFPLPYADASEGFADNPFTLRYAGMQLPPVPESIDGAAVDFPSDAPPSGADAGADAPPPPLLAARPTDPGADARTDAARAAPPPAPPIDRGPPSFVMDTRLALSVLLPGPRGLSLSSISPANTYNPVGTLNLTRRISERLSVVMEGERETFSLNRLIVRAAWDAGPVVLEAGPVMGILNTQTLDISPALSVLLRVRLPAWNLSGTFRVDTPLGREPAAPGDYTHAYTAASVAYAFPLVRLTLVMSGRSSTLLDDDWAARVGRWTRFGLAADFPFVPAPWGFRLEAGYELLQWDHRLAIPLSYRYSAVYAGLEASYTLPSGFLTFIAGLEGPVYPFVYPSLARNLNGAAFYGRLTLGCRAALW